MPRRRRRELPFAKFVEEDFFGLGDRGAGFDAAKLSELILLKSFIIKKYSSYLKESLYHAILGFYSV